MMVGIKVGRAFAIPVARVTTACKAVSNNNGRFSRIPVTRAITSCRAPSAIWGKASINPVSNAKIISEAVSMIVGRLSIRACASEPTISPTISRSSGKNSIIISRTFGRISPMTSDILLISPLASRMPFVNSPSRALPSVARSVSTGSNTVPRAFLAAVAPTLKYCNWSSKAP